MEKVDDQIYLTEDSPKPLIFKVTIHPSLSIISFSQWLLMEIRDFKLGELEGAT